MLKIKRFKDLPWLNPLFEDIYYCSYDARHPKTMGHRVFVPKDNSTVGINHTFNAAYKFGTTHVEMGRWKAFKLVMEHGEAAGAEFNWPHIHLLPIPHEPKEEPNE